ncbi:hypothetical protein HORM4_250030 [Vibrio harveyi]|nr:hypothetical protein HORM4_250030 [Vibrio harveyi]
MRSTPYVQTVYVLKQLQDAGFRMLPSMPFLPKVSKENNAVR